MPDSVQDGKHGLERLSLRKWNWQKEEFPFSLQNSSAESFVSAKNGRFDQTVPFLAQEPQKAINRLRCIN